MLTMKKIRRTYGQPICRACINNNFNLRLRSVECRYRYGSETCPACGEMKHIVIGFRWKGYLKGLFARSTAYTGLISPRARYFCATGNRGDFCNQQPETERDN